MKELVNSAEMGRILDRLVFQIVETCPSLDELCIVGVHRRGVPLAHRIRELLKRHHEVDIPLGTLDITLYRDDLSEIANFPMVYGTELNFDINNMNMILVDDVIYTGRTVRAALEAILDFGRPKKIMMLALVDRGHRELPIQPDFVGRVIPTSRKEVVNVSVKEIDGTDSISIGEYKK